MAGLDLEDVRLLEEEDSPCESCELFEQHGKNCYFYWEHKKECSQHSKY